MALLLLLTVNVVEDFFAAADDDEGVAVVCFAVEEEAGVEDGGRFVAVGVGEVVVLPLVLLGALIGIFLF